MDRVAGDGTNWRFPAVSGDSLKSRSTSARGLQDYNVSPDMGAPSALVTSIMTPSADAIADCVLATFEQLPDKRKPRPRTDGSREWVPLSGIVLSQGNTPTKSRTRLVAYAYRIVKMASSRACL
jgi:hypothetical protein